MTRASPALLRLAVVNNAMASPLMPHQARAITAASFGHLLNEHELWFLNTVRCLSAVSDRQRARLHEISAKVERERL